MSSLDKEIRNKICKLINSNYMLATKDSKQKQLDKYFPDVTIECNGNNLLHYIAEYHEKYCEYASYYDTIRILLKRGLHLADKNDKGKNFLNIIVEQTPISLPRLIALNEEIKLNKFNSILINNRDNNGNAVMITLLKKFEKTIEYSESYLSNSLNKKIVTIEEIIESIKTIFSTLTDLGYNQIEIIGEKETNVFELIKSIQIKYQEKFNDNLDMNWDEDLMSIYYYRHPVEFATEYFTEDKEENFWLAKKYLNFSPLFPRDNELLFICQKNKGSFTEKINATRKYLEIGLNPNHKIEYNDLPLNFVEYAIKNKANINYIHKLVELAIEYGLDLNDCNIVEIMVKENYQSDYISLIKVLVEQNGGKKINNFTNIRTEAFMDVFRDVAKKFNLKYDWKEIFDDNFINIFFDVIDHYNFANDLTYDHDFITQTVMQIIEDRNNAVAPSDKIITKLEIINALKNLICKRTENEFNKFLAKTLSTHTEN